MINSIAGLFIVLISIYWIYSNANKKRMPAPLSRLIYIRSLILATGLMTIGFLLLFGKLEII